MDVDVTASTPATDLLAFVVTEPADKLPDKRRTGDSVDEYQIGLLGRLGCSSLVAMLVAQIVG
jgi:hypothetical protein